MVELQPLAGQFGLPGHFRQDVFVKRSESVETHTHAPVHWSERTAIVWDDDRVLKQNCTHLPPPILVQLVLLYDLNPITRAERYLVGVLWCEVVYCVDIFWHIGVYE